ncbi:flavin reductase family protein [Saccharomonospora piscinae]|nr:flavin reductase family protein [Saccharomonospora piscinae]
MTSAARFDPAGWNGTASRDQLAKETDFRALMSTFPSGVAVVTSQDQQGALRGSTCTSLCSVSLRPPILLVSLHLRSGTLATIRRAGSFAVNFLHSRGRYAAELFSTAVADRFRRIEWERTPNLSQPWLVRDAHATAECRLTETVEVADHGVVFGVVREVLTVRGAPAPLLYGQREYRRWPEALTAEG